MDKSDAMPPPTMSQEKPRGSLSPDVNLHSTNGSLGATSSGAVDSGYESLFSRESIGSPEASENNVAASLGPVSSTHRLVDEAHCYRMDRRKRGKCIIFNNREFDASTAMNSRPGSDLDAKNMYDIFQSVLQFEVTLLHNQTTMEMLQRVANVAAENHHDSDCFALVILSHGREELVYGRDGFVKLSTLIEPLKGSGCPSLIGKPKLIFIQACRGEQFDEGVNVSDAKPDDERPTAEKAYKIPTEADFLYAFSSAPGFYSFRNSTRGSWFIQAITEIFKKHGTELELMQLLTRVNRKVAYDFESKSDNKEHSGKKQVPSIVSLLTKELYFSKKK